MKKETLCQIEQVIGYKFSDQELLKMAFTHSSSVDDRKLSYERLEFLGDAVLGLVICQKLFELFPNYDEGELTKIKSLIVSRKCCAAVTKKLGLDQFLKVGKGMASTRAFAGSLAAGLLEAIIAGIYIDGGFGAAEKFIRDGFDDLIIKSDLEESKGNYKSMLQQYAQKKYNSTPGYVLLDEKGPDHVKCFEVEAVISAHHFQSAWGMNKKEAEQKAAFNALVELGVVEEGIFETSKEGE